MTAVALLLALAAQDQSGEPGARTAMGIRVEVDALWPHPAIGFPYPVRVRIENGGPARQIECEVDGSDFGWDEALGWNSRRSLRLGEMEKVQFSLLVPASTGHGLLHFRVNRAEFPGMTRSIPGTGGFPQHLVVDHRRTFTPSDLENAFGKNNTSYGSGVTRCVVLSPERLSGEWQAYAGLAGVWIQARDWKQAAPAAREAILRAAKAGQRVLFYNIGSESLEAAAFEGRKNGWAEPLPEGRGIADEGFAFGFGKILGLRGDIVGKGELPARYKMDGANLLDSHFTTETAAIPGVGDPPRVTFFWIVLAFAFLLGPINLMIVSRFGRRVLFLVTTPILALFAVTVLVTYSAVHEGFGIHGNVRTIGFLNPDEKELALCSSVSIYSGVYPGRWPYRPETLCVDTASRHRNPQEYYYRSGRRSSQRTAEVDWSQGQNISGGWVPSRELRGLNTAQVVPCRGRLVLERGAEGKIRLHNALGADILSGHLKFDGRWHAIPAVAEGATGEVQERSHAPGDDKFARLETLPEGGFAVTLKEAPELDLAAKKINMAVSLHLLRGWVSETR